MKNILISVSILVAMVLSGCGGETETPVDSNVETTEEQQTENNEQRTETKKKETKPAEEEISQVVVDDANVTITYKGTVLEEDDIYGKQAKIKFQIVNKSDSSIEIQSRELSTDNVMVDETLIAYSETVAAGKTANTNINISEYEGYEFPTFNDNIELTLLVMNEETWDTLAEYPVSISIK